MRTAPAPTYVIQSVTIVAARAKPKQRAMPCQRLSTMILQTNAYASPRILALFSKLDIKIVANAQQQPVSKDTVIHRNLVEGYPSLKAMQLRCMTQRLSL